jgi:hypothetical protein
MDSPLGIGSFLQMYVNSVTKPEFLFCYKSDFSDNYRDSVLQKFSKEIGWKSRNIAISDIKKKISQWRE